MYINKGKEETAKSALKDQFFGTADFFNIMIRLNKGFVQEEINDIFVEDSCFDSIRDVDVSENEVLPRQTIRA